ncbi:MAG: class I SAM-dependent rRNA methyltransferase [Persicimonas sp.]
MQLTFQAPAEDPSPTLEELVRRAWPLATDEQIRAVFEEDRVRVDERLSRNPERPSAFDEEVTVEAASGAEEFGMPEAAELARGEGWVVVEKPVGMPGALDRDDPMNPVLFLADSLGLDRAQFTPVWTMPTAMGGPWLFGQTPERARELLEAWASGDLMITWVTLTPSPEQAQGRLDAEGGMPVIYSASQMREGISELQLTPQPQEADFETPPEPVPLLLDALAEAGLTALGDARRGGLMVDGGLRIRANALYGDASGLAHSWNPDRDWWPDQPVVILPEEKPEAEAEEEPADEIDMLVDEAIARRADLIRETTATDLYRLIHGRADGLPGLYVDRVGPLLRATVFEEEALAMRERVYQNILDFDPDMMILEVEHLRDIRKEETPTAEVVAQGAGYVREGDRVVGVEDGLKFWCEPWEGVDVGFFADQRENRRKLRGLAGEGERWLNLFCHTGAFSVALASVGCQVVSVDLSKRYIRWLDENFELNGLSEESNISIAEDARAYLARCDETFDGIIVDPPTAAHGPEGFWSVRNDYEDLLVDCFELLEEGGTMLVCRNDKSPSTPLDEVVKAAAERAGRTVTFEEAPPAPDYPRLEGDPESASFEGVWVEA